MLKKLPPVRGEHANAVRVPRLAGAEKLPPVRDEPPAQFACPGQPVQEKEPPVRGEHANAVRVPRSAGAEKLPPVRGEPLDRCRITGEICDTTLFYYKMHPLLRQAQPPGEA